MFNRLLSKVKRTNFIRRSKKKHSRTSPDVQFNEISLTKQLDLERTMREFGKPSLKKSDKKTKSNVKMQREKKTSEKSKFDSNKKLGLERTMNGLGKPFGKKSDLKN